VAAAVALDAALLSLVEAFPALVEAELALFFALVSDVEAFFSDVAALDAEVAALSASSTPRSELRSDLVLYCTLPDESKTQILSDVLVKCVVSVPARVLAVTFLALTSPVEGFKVGT
jgi:hypothetical protein